MRRKWKEAVSFLMTAVMTITAVGFTTDTTAQAADFATGSKVSRTTARVAVHDPSVVDGQDGYYYIFGSHMAWARSKDLLNWSTFTTNINSNYRTIFATPGNWAARGGGSYDISGNLWAPDVIYNKKMGKWCMYMSVNGNDYCSSIALATADKITGPYTYQGTVVYSGFTNSSARSYTYTDYQKATGSTNISWYLSGGNWNLQYGTNAIDPCVIYDENGDLWMSYGSWFGGIYMLKLDESTGLRDYSYTYTTKANKSDAYMGLKLAGGYGQSGEGSYIVHDEESGYYYLYLSYCGLNATDNFSGYHLRMYRSKDIKGPYKDAAGNNAIYTSASENQSVHGIKLFGNYAFSSLGGNGENSANGYMSGGHNSAFIDDDGNHFLIYHTRFNVGQEWHEVRVHQQFLNEDGWPVTAPYEYQGSKISETGYSRDEIAGCYEIINHGLAATTEYTGMLETKKVILLGNGTIAGDVSGSWSEKEGSYYATMNVDGVEYKGVFFKQYDESASHKEVMTFSLIGNDNTSVWGSKISRNTTLIKQGIDTLFAGSVTGNIEIPSFGENKVTFSTDSEYLKVNDDGTELVYSAPEKDTAVTVTAKIAAGSSTISYSVKTLVKGYQNTDMTEQLLAYYSFDGASIGEDASGQKNHLTAYNTTKTTDSERGSVAYFNGNNAYMKLPSSVTDTDSFTFMAWVKSSENRSWERIFDFGDGEGNSLFLTTHGYTPECVRASYAVNSEEIKADSDSILTTGHWVNLAVTIDAVNKKMALYINGEFVSQTALTSNLTDSFKGTKNYLGKSQYDADVNFRGYMDDVAIFSSALSSQEIKAFMADATDKEVKTVDQKGAFLSVASGSYLDFGSTDVSSANPAIAYVCKDGTVRAVSDGDVRITAGGHTMKLRVEKQTGINYGDVNQDGSIDVLDMEDIQKDLLGIRSLTGQARKAAGLDSSDGTLSVLDMEIIQKHLLGIGWILK